MPGELGGDNGGLQNRARAAILKERLKTISSSPQEVVDRFKEAAAKLEEGRLPVFSGIWLLVFESAVAARLGDVLKLEPRSLPRVVEEYLKLREEISPVAIDPELFEKLKELGVVSKPERQTPKDA